MKTDDQPAELALRQAARDLRVLVWQGDDGHWHLYAPVRGVGLSSHATPADALAWLRASPGGRA